MLSRRSRRLQWSDGDRCSSPYRRRRRSSRPRTCWPRLAASVPGFAIDIWVGVLAPAGTPAALIDRLNHEINAIAASPELATILEPDGTVAAAMTPAAFAARVKEELSQWKQIASDHKIIAE